MDRELRAVHPSQAMALWADRMVGFQGFYAVFLPVLEPAEEVEDGVTAFSLEQVVSFFVCPFYSLLFFLQLWGTE